MSCNFDPYLGYCYEGDDWQQECFNCYNPTLGGGNNQGGGNSGGLWGGQGTYSQTLQAILSGLGLLQGAHYVPTGLQVGQVPQGASGLPPVVNNYYGNPAGGNSSVGGTNAFGGIQRYIEQHPTAVLAGVVFVGGALVLLMAKPPVRRNGVKRRRR